uniref:DDE-1 domain-containing protein n=2 Tax=Photinus pyralis TaxID=7054 RepID=A0A1Y1KZ51_PHOPY
MGKYKRRLGARKYMDYEASALERALQAMKEGMSSRRAETLYNIPRRTLLNKMKHIHTGDVGRPSLSQAEERSLVDVLIASAEFGSPMTELDLRMLVRNYLDQKGISLTCFKENLPGRDWVYLFLKRNKTKLTKRTCQNIKRCRAEKTSEEFETLQDVPPQNILNYDETNLSDNPGTTKCIFFRGTKYPERRMNTTKSAISLMFSATAAGELLPCYVVYKAERMYSSWIEGGPPNTIYNRTKSGWFDAGTFVDYFNKVVIPWARRLKGPKVVIGDNLSSHLNVDVLLACQRNNIRFVFLPPNSTHITQPLDVSFFGPLKKAWRTILQDVKLKYPSQNCVEKSFFPGLLAKLIKTIELKSEKNIKNGFRATGIVPLCPDEVLKKMPTARYKERVSREIDNSLLDFLQSQNKRGERVQRNKKKMLHVEPGASVSVADLPIAQNKTSVEYEVPAIESEVQDAEPEVDSVESEVEDVESEVQTRSDPEERQIKVGDHVVVEIKGKKFLKYHYVAVVLETDDENDSLFVKFMKKGLAGFIFPPMEDTSTG